MGADDVNIGVRIDANFKDLIKAVNQSNTLLNAMTQNFAQLQAQMAKTAKATNVANAATAGQVKGSKAAANAVNAQTLANKRLAQSETLVSQIYTKNSSVAQKKYLSNLTGLRAGLQRFREESHRVMVLEKGHISLLDEQNNAFKRFMIQGNMVVRTMDAMAQRTINMGKNMQWTGRQMMVGITMPLLGIGAATLRFGKAAGDVDRQLRRVVEGGEKAISVLNESAVELSNTWGVNVEQIKAMQVSFAQAGFDTAQIKNLTRQTQEFATVGDVAVESAQEMVQALALTGKTGEDLTMTLAKLNLIDDETSLSMQGVADALPKIVSLFKAYGGTVEQAAALLAAFTDNSIDAVEGANAIKAVLTKMPAGMAGLNNETLGGTRLVGLRNALKTMQQMTGIDMKMIDDNGKVRKSLDILVQLASAIGKLGETDAGLEARAVFLREMFGSTQNERGLQLMNELNEALIDTTGNATKLNGVAKAMQIAMGDGTQSMAEYLRQIQVSQNDPWIKLQTTWQKLRNTAIDFGTKHVLPVATKLLGQITNLIEKFQALSPATKDLIIKFALGAAALGPLIYGLGQVTIMFGTLGQMVFTKPLKALFHLGSRVKGLITHSSQAKDAIDDLLGSFMAGDIDRAALKSGVEKELLDEAKRRAQSQQISQARLQASVNKTTAAIVNQASAAKAANTAMAASTATTAAAASTAAAQATAAAAATQTAATAAVTAATTGTVANVSNPVVVRRLPLKAAPRTGPLRADLTAEQLRLQYPELMRKIEDRTPGARDAMFPDPAAIDAELASRLSRGPRKLSKPNLIKSLKARIQVLKNAEDEIHFASTAIMGDDPFADHYKPIVAGAQRDAKALRGIKKRWERYVPLLIEHTDITSAQLNDMAEMERIFAGIEKHLPKYKGGFMAGKPIRSKSNIVDVLTRSQVAGPNGLNVRDVFPGQRQLRELLKTDIPAMRKNITTRGGRSGATMLPYTALKEWTEEFQHLIIQEMMDDTTGKWGEVGTEAAREKVAQLTDEYEKARKDVVLRRTDPDAYYRALDAAERKLSDGIAKVLPDTGALDKKLASKISRDMTDLFKPYKLTGDDLKRASDDLLRSVGASGSDAVLDHNAVVRFASEIEQGRVSVAELIRSGRIPQRALDQIASSLYTGSSAGEVVTQLYKEGARTGNRINAMTRPEDTVKGMKDRGFTDQQIRRHIAEQRKKLATRRQSIAELVAAVQDELMVMDGMDRESVLHLRRASELQGLGAAEGQRPGEVKDSTRPSKDRDAFKEFIGVQDDRSEIYNKRIKGLEQQLNWYSKKATESNREYRQRVARWKRKELTRLRAERDRIKAAIRAADMELRAAMRITEQGDVLLDGKVATRDDILNARDEIFKREYDRPDRVATREKMARRGNQILANRDAKRVASRAAAAAPAAAALGLDTGPLPVSSIPEGATTSIKRHNRALQTLRGTGGKLVGRGGILSPTTWRNASQGIATSTRSFSRLSKSVSSVKDISNQAMQAMTGFTLVGSGGIATMLKSALPIIGILTAIAAAVYFIWKNWDEVGPHVIDGLKALKDAAKNVFNAVVEPFKTMFGIVDEGAAKGKSMSETWQTLGDIINKSMKLVSTALNIFAVAIRPIMQAIAFVAYMLVGLFNAFGKLPAAIQMVVAALLLLQFTAVRAALGRLIDGIAILLFNLAGIPFKAQAAAASLSGLQAALIPLTAGLMLFSAGIQNTQKHMQNGANAAREYWAALAKDYSLDDQRAVSDSEAAIDEATAKIEELRRQEAELRGEMGNSAGERLSREFGRLTPWNTHESDVADDVTEIKGQIEQQEELIAQEEQVVIRLNATMKKLRGFTGMGDKQLRDFARQYGISLVGPTDRVVERFKKKWAEFRDEWRANNAAIADEPLDLPVDTTKIDEAKQKADTLISTLRSQLMDTMQGWKEAALKAFDDYVEKELEIYDKQIEAIDAVTKAEDDAYRERERIRRREELALRRREMGMQYLADRELAIYEGRYDDAAGLDLSFQRDSADLDEEERAEEENYQKEQTRLTREAEKDRLNDLKDAKKEQFDVQKEALAAQLEELTRFAPRSAAAAAAIQQGILAAMDHYAPGYATNALKSTKAWNTGWTQAFANTKKMVADDAWWAGTEALQAFAKGLGINPADLEMPTAPPSSSGPGGSSAGISYTNTPGVTGSGTSARYTTPDGRPGMPVYHSGGRVGNPAGAPQDVKATLQTGEFVVQRKAVAKYGTDLLSALNEGQIYHEGGFVGAAGRLGLRGGFKKAASAFFNKGAAMSNMTWEKVQNAYRNAAGGGGFAGGMMDVAGKTIAEIVDTMISGIHPEFAQRLAAWNASLGGKYQTHRGYRSMAEQAYLYDRWLRRVPGQALAAPPGSSMHNFGLAVDLLPTNTTAQDRKAGEKFGLRWPMDFEPWHVEPVEARAWRAAMLSGVFPQGSQANLDSGGLRVIEGLFGSAAGTSGGSAVGGTDVASAKAIVRGMMGQFGWGDGFWPALERLVQKESSWNYLADNPTSTAAGLFQKMTSIHGPLESTIAGQAQWGLNYIKGRYGDPIKALAFHDRNGWYHKGGLAQLKKGGQTLNDGIAKLHRNETVLTEPLSKELIDGIRNMNSGGEIHLHIGQFFGTDREIEKLGKELDRVMMKNRRAKGNISRTFDK